LACSKLAVEEISEFILNQEFFFASKKSAALTLSLSLPLLNLSEFPFKQNNQCWAVIQFGWLELSVSVNKNQAETRSVLLETSECLSFLDF
jgi:hypothetical protein